MSESEDEMKERSTVNRLAALQAEQQQLSEELRQLGASVKTGLVLGLYTLGVALLIFAAIRYPSKLGVKAS